MSGRGNGAYVGSGHLPDVSCVAPFFCRNQLIGFTCNTAHHADVGGTVPGSRAIENVYDLYA